MFAKPLLVCLINALAFNHALYISVLEIKSEGATTELVLRIFPEDLRDAIRAETGEIIKQEVGAMPSSDLDLVHGYISSKLEVKTEDGSLLQLKLGTIEQVGDAWEIKLLTDRGLSGEVEISNSLLIELFPTQNNIVKALGGSPAFLRFDNVDTILRSDLK